MCRQGASRPAQAEASFCIARRGGHGGVPEQGAAHPMHRLAHRPIDAASLALGLTPAPCMRSGCVMYEISAWRFGAVAARRAGVCRKTPP